MRESGSGEPRSSNTGSDKSPPNVCEICGSTHDSEKGLQIHRTMSHNGGENPEYECDSCGYGCNSQPGFISHLTNECPEAGYECSECGRVHPTERGRNHHLSEVHGIQNHVDIECANCGDVSTVEPHRVNDERDFYCSNKCKGEATGPTPGPYPTSECVVCGSEFETIPSMKNRLKTCSKTCESEHRSNIFSGENSPVWKGGWDSKMNAGFQRQRRKAIQRDGGVCRNCGATAEENGRALSVHHITPRREFLDGDDFDSEAAHALDNLVTLCTSCHHTYEGLPIAPERP